MYLYTNPNGLVGGHLIVATHGRGWKQPPQLSFSLFSSLELSDANVYEP